jgi:hypothetical protein
VDQLKARDPLADARCKARRGEPILGATMTSSERGWILTTTIAVMVVAGGGLWWRIGFGSQPGDRAG